MSDVIQRAFNAGEVAEEYWLRNDLEWFNRSVRSLVNFIPLSGGALVRRPGTIKKYELPFKPITIEKIPSGELYGFNEKSSFLIVGSDGTTVKFTILKFDETISSVGGISPIGGFPNPSTVQIEIAKTNTDFKFIVAFKNNFETCYDVSYSEGFNSWSSTPLVSTNGGMIPPVISVNIPGGGPTPVYYQVSAVTSGGVESKPSAIASHNGNSLSVANPATITWNEPNYNGYSINKYYVYRVESGVSRFVGDVSAVSTGTARTFVDYAFNRDINLGPIQNSVPGVDAYTVANHQQRVVYGYRDEFYASRTGTHNSFVFGTPISNSDSFRANITEIGEIKYIRSINGELMFFTDFGIYVNRGDSTGSLTPTSIGVDLRWADPVSGYQPLLYKNSVMYLNSNYQLKLLTRSQTGGDNYTSINLSEFTYKIDKIGYSGYYTTGQIKFEKGINDLIWVRRNLFTTGTAILNDSWRGIVLGDNETFGWGTYKTDGRVAAANSEIVVVERLVNGVSKYYIEEFQPLVDDRVTGCYLDCAIRFSAPFTQTISVPHLAGMTVKAVVDGLEQGPFTVSSTGSVTLTTTPTTSLLVGLPYESSVTTHSLDLVGVSTLVRQPKATSCANIYFKNTANGEVRVNSDPWQDIRLRDESDGYNPTALKSGLTEDIYLATSPRREQTISIRQKSPFPMTIVAIARSIKGA